MEKHLIEELINDIDNRIQQTQKKWEKCINQLESVRPDIASDAKRWLKEDIEYLEHLRRHYHAEQITKREIWNK